MSNIEENSLMIQARQKKLCGIPINLEGLTDNDTIVYNISQQKFVRTALPSPSQGNGDMTKTVYDYDDDGIVDNSEKLEGSTKAQVQDHVPQAHNQGASTIDSGTLDGDRLPVLSTTKKGGVPATGTPSGKFLKDDNTWATPAGGSGTPDLSYYRRTGTTRERWYTVPTTATAMTVSTALTTDRIYAHPFIVPKTVTLDRIAVNCTTLVASGKLRLGIYDSLNGEPNSRILDAGEVDTSTTGVKSLTINPQLTAGLYWLVAASNSATHAFRVPAIAATINVVGVASSLGTAVMTHYYASFTYGALPSTFPTVTDGTTLVYPAVFVRLSA